MKYQQEYRDPGAIRRLAQALERLCTRPHTIMEVCGGQTHAFLRFGLEQLLPSSLELVHGPGCPVCVTPESRIDEAVALSLTPGVLLCTFGDMLRVPGSSWSLAQARARGAQIQAVYSPLDVLAVAAAQPERQVVFFGVGFETTAPAVAMLAYQAKRQRLQNLSLLLAHVLVPPAMEAVMASPDCRVQAFLAAGHVCAVMGITPYQPLVDKYRVPVVVTGFEPLDLLEGLRRCVLQLEQGRAEVENAYARVVPTHGNPVAQELLLEVFEVTPRTWRGFGELPASGLELSAAYAELDARRRFEIPPTQEPPDRGCISALVLQGRKKPPECPHFGQTCTPDHPLGATMVSAEGACAAYLHYRV